MARALMTADTWKAKSRPLANSTLSTPAMAAGLEEDMTDVMTEYGSASVITRMATLKLRT